METTTTKWTVDPAHSELTFKVKHLMISTVTGHFRNFSVQALTKGDDFSDTYDIELVADVDSLYTNNEQRDNHLRSADFFDAAQHPKLVFKAGKFNVGSGEAKLSGELTIRGITKLIAMDVEHGGIVTDPYGQTKAAFSVAGKLSRKEFGLTWNALTEAGGVVVGDEVKIHAEIQLIRQA
jgi:polyisoprenoid-binding protein YceI